MICDIALLKVIAIIYVARLCLQIRFYIGLPDKSYILIASQMLGLFHICISIICIGHVMCIF